MLTNIRYNLIESISIISRGLYRYDTYVKDAAECPACQGPWGQFKERREKELSMLLKELKSHIDGGKVSFE